MKLSIENFFLPIKYGLIGILLALPLNAKEQEIWYDAQGEPILIKDIISGRLRVLSVEEVAALTKVKQEVVTPTVSDAEIDPVDKSLVTETTPTQTVTNTTPRVPFVLAPKVYAENKYYLHRPHYYSPYYSTYPYISGPVIPRFSNNGYYGPAQYYRPSYQNSYYRNYNRNCGNGFLLRYSRPGLNIRARF